MVKVCHALNHPATCRSQVMLLREKDDVSELRVSLERLQAGGERAKVLETLQADKCAVEAENVRLRRADERTQHEWRELAVELQGARREQTELRQRHAALEGAHGECRQQLNVEQVEVSKLANKYQVGGRRRRRR